MRITVETKWEPGLVGDFHSHPGVYVRVKVDGEDELALSHLVTEAEMGSHFDILWEYIGSRVKDAHKSRLGVAI